MNENYARTWFLADEKPKKIKEKEEDPHEGGIIIIVKGKRVNPTHWEAEVPVIILSSNPKGHSCNFSFSLLSPTSTTSGYYLQTYIIHAL